MPLDTPFPKYRLAADAVRAGGVIAYPTEGVYGLGCDPEEPDAVARILAMKRRPVEAGLILIAASDEQLSDWIAPTEEERRTMLYGPLDCTWVVTASSRCPPWITGGRSTCAVRVTRFAPAAALCLAAGRPLVSTSANRRHQPAARTALATRRLFRRVLDYLLPGATGNASGASEIRHAASGQILRPAVTWESQAPAHSR